MVEDNGQCVQCGHCCTTSACDYGVWDDEKKQCAFLLPDNICAKYNTIKESEQEFPMFGSGCSLTLFNERRQTKLKELLHESKS